MKLKSNKMYILDELKQTKIRNADLAPNWNCTKTEIKNNSCYIEIEKTTKKL